MYFKTYQHSHNKNDLTIKVYPNGSDYDEISDRNSWKALHGELYTQTHVNLNKVVDHVLNEHSFQHKFNYVRIVLKYPLYYQKLETVGEWTGGARPMKDYAFKAVVQVLDKFYAEMLHEYKYISHEQSIQYVYGGNNNFDCAVERALQDGQFVVYMLSSPEPVPEPQFFGDFKENRVCITYDTNGLPMLLHEDEEELRKLRDEEIDKARFRILRGEDDDMKES